MLCVSLFLVCLPDLEGFGFSLQFAAVLNEKKKRIRELEQEVADLRAASKSLEGNQDPNNSKVPSLSEWSSIAHMQVTWYNAEVLCHLCSVTATQFID